MECWESKIMAAVILETLQDTPHKALQGGYLIMWATHENKAYYPEIKFNGR